MTSSFSIEINTICWWKYPNILVYYWFWFPGCSLTCANSFLCQIMHVICCQDGSGVFVLEGNIPVYWSSFLDGLQRVLLFSWDYTFSQGPQEAGHILQQVTVSIQGLGLSLVNDHVCSELMYISISKWVVSFSCVENEPVRNVCREPPSPCAPWASSLLRRNMRTNTAQ